MARGVSVNRYALMLRGSNTSFQHLHKYKLKLEKKNLISLKDTFVVLSITEQTEKRRSIL